MSIVFLFFLTGLVLFFIESLFPGVGIFGITGVISFIAGIVFAYFYFPAFFMQIVILELIVIILFILALIYFINTKSGIVENLTLTETLNEDIQKEIPKDILGKVGICKTTLKPVGIVTIENVDYEVLSKSKYQNIGDKVTVTSISNNKIFVEYISDNL